MGPFFRLPNLGGRLAILNAALWLILFTYIETYHRGTVSGNGMQLLVMGVVIALSLPLTPCFLTIGGMRGIGGIDGLILFGCLLAANSFLWGYGLIWLFGYISSGRASRQ